MIKCKSSNSFSLQSMGEKIYERVLVHRDAMTKGLIDGEQRNFKSGKRCVYQIFT